MAAILKRQLRKDREKVIEQVTDYLRELPDGAEVTMRIQRGVAISEGEYFAEGTDNGTRCIIIQVYGDVRTTNE